jgi:hypothetical protein
LPLQEIEHSPCQNVEVLFWQCQGKSLMKICVSKRNKRFFAPVSCFVLARKRAGVLTRPADGAPPGGNAGMRKSPLTGIISRPPGKRRFVFLQSKRCVLPSLMQRILPHESASCAISL